MAKKTFKSVHDLMKYIKDEVYDSLNTDVKDKVVDKTKDNIEEMVYENPPDNEVDYERTYQLLDSVIGTTKRSEKEIHLSIFNDIDLMSGHNSWVSPFKPQFKYIANWIINGTDSPLYSHEPRDYISKTVDDLNSDKEHIDTLKKSLNKKGIKTK